ncbi:MAG: glycosyltransferase [Chloroflexi bacterium]|nr:glycosyltransferase [Chloroflexota bacterium]
MKRVLIVTFDFPPQGGTGVIRVTKFVKYLPQFGWQPVVVCSDAHSYPDPSLARDVPPDLPVYREPWRPFASLPRRSAPAAPSAIADRSRQPVPSGALNKLARRFFVPDPYVGWTGAAARLCARALQEHPCQAALTTSPPNSIHLVGERVHARFGLPWVADFRDVWTCENPTLGKLGRLNFALQRKTERRVLERCDRALVVSEPLARSTFESLGSDLAPKTRVLTNGFDPEDFADPPPPLDSPGVTFSYVGSIHGPRGNTALAPGIRLALEQNDDFRRDARFRFVGLFDGPFRAQLAGLESNVEFLDFTSHAEAVDRMRRSHVLLLALPSDEERLGYTNKLFEYLAARRPILAAVPPGAVSELMRGSNLGLVVPHDEPAAVARGLIDLFRREPSDTSDRSDELRARFDRRNLAQQLARILDEVSSGAQESQ